MVKEIIKGSKLDTIHAKWEELYIRGRDKWHYSFLQSYECATMVMKSFYWHPLRWTYNPFFIYVKTNAGEAIFPLAISHNKKEIRDFYCFSPIDYIDFVTDITDPIHLKALFFECIKDYCDYQLTFTHFEEWSSIYSIFKNHGNLQKEICVQIILQEKSYDDYYKSLSKHQRQNVRTAYNKLGKNNIALCVKEYDANNPVPFLIKKECQRIYEERCDIKNSHLKFKYLRKYWRRKAYFINDMIFLSSKRHTFVLFFDDTPVAFASGYFDDVSEIFYVPRLSTSERFLKYSAGIILVNEIVKILIERDFHVFDLTRGMEPYKYAMGGAEHYTYYIHCGNNSLKLSL